MTIIILLILFQFKHLIADYYLQFPYMYKNKGNKEKWIEPLFHHASVHGWLTFIIALVYSDIITASVVMVLDVATHFYIDRWKATRKSKIDESQFWINLGWDQMLHHIIGIIIVCIIMISI